MASRKANLQAGTREDAKAVYLAVYDSAIVTDIPDVAAKLKLNRRYANELIETLQAVKDANGSTLVYLDTRAGEENNDTPHDWFGASVNIDSQTREEAEALFDAAWPNDTGSNTPTTRQGNTKEYTVPKDTNPADLPLCRCGCGFPVNNRKRNYLPGHDARHAGQVARAMAAIPGKDNEDKRAAMLDALPTDALRWKAATMADRLIAKGDAQIERALAGARRHEDTAKKAIESIAKVTPEAGNVKVGRWFYEAERNPVSGAVNWTDKKGKVHVATDAVAATFTAYEDGGK